MIWSSNALLLLFFSYTLARFTPALTTLTIIDSHLGFSAMGLMMLIEHCTQLSYLQLATSPWTVKELGEFVGLFEKDKSEPKEFKHVWMMNGGLCLQFVSLTLAQEMTEGENALLLVKARKRFPVLRTLDFTTA